MASFLTDNPDLQYYLGSGIDWELVATVSERGFGDPAGFRNTDEARASYRGVAGMVGGFSAREVAPFAAQIDKAC